MDRVNGEYVLQGMTVAESTTYWVASAKVIVDGNGAHCLTCDAHHCRHVDSVRTVLARVEESSRRRRGRTNGKASIRTQDRW